MLKIKATFLIGLCLSVSSCMSDSIRSLQLSSPKPSLETTSSIRPSSPLRNINNADYAAWKTAYTAYNRQASAYWDDVGAKRKLRNEKRAHGQTIELSDYVLKQPPLYKGPPKPATDRKTASRSVIPGVNDFIAASKRVYGFVPERPTNESEFMRTYVNAAQEIGLTREQLVSIYAFETGGDGTHDLQAGMLKEKANASPISTAIGYNQLVATASVSLMWEYGNEIAKELRQQAQNAPVSVRTKLQQKAMIVEQMTTQAKTVPHNWASQAELAKTDAGLGIHAMTMDKDVGPLLQIHKLKTSLAFLKRKGLSHTLSGAELEMLNLTGDGNGYDMVTMPASFRNKVPTANFFLRTGYERNPVAIRNNTVAALLNATENKMQINMQKNGAQMLDSIFQSTTIANN